MRKKILFAILVTALAVCIAVPAFATVLPAKEKPIDIKPTSCPNPLNVKSKGVLPVAILGYEYQPSLIWDVTNIDVASIELEGVAPLRYAYKDVATPPPAPSIPPGWPPDWWPPTACNDCITDGPDEILDLTLKFDRQAVVAALESEYGPLVDGQCLVVYLTGTYDTGTGDVEFYGRDILKIIKKGN